jgi:glycosyltransferase involved in cell wall biosynthesis
MAGDEISVEVCTRQEERMIEQCLGRLAHQKISPELIVVDAHSTDGTREIARNYADTILLDNGGGLSEARNRG